MARKEREFLLGDEAVALAALDAGISGAYAYPGTPSTEIFQFIEARSKKLGIQAWWVANEKVAYEQAIGMSYAGHRVLVSMKHVGLNVALDPFMGSAMTGVNGALVVVVADDPGMHSSQNEQDTRVLARFALLPCLEPAGQQDAYEMTREAFEMSESLGLPVVVRLVTRLAHSRGIVVPMPARPPKPLPKTKDRASYTLLPVNARRDYQRLVQQQEKLARLSEESRWNRQGPGEGGRRGVIACGTAYNYVAEAFGGDVPLPFLHLGMYPLPLTMLHGFLEGLDEVVVVEECYPVVEELLRSAGQAPGKKVHGKLDGTLPRTGEMSPTVLRAAFDLPTPRPVQPKLDPLPPRPPVLCVGCPHGDTFLALKDAISGLGDVTLFSDIGCYTMGYYPPYEAADTCVEMGASIGMAVGAAQAGVSPAIAIIGDSTFSHSGLSPLLSAVKEKVDLKLFVLDNGSVAMTGNQTPIIGGDDLVRLVEGLGVDPARIRIMDPRAAKREENARMIREEIAAPGLAVIISRRPCILHGRHQLGKGG